MLPRGYKWKVLVTRTPIVVRDDESEELPPEHEWRTTPDGVRVVSRIGVPHDCYFTEEQAWRAHCAKLGAADPDAPAMPDPTVED